METSPEKPLKDVLTPWTIFYESWAYKQSRWFGIWWKWWTVVSIHFIYTYSEERKYKWLNTAYCYSERIPSTDVFSIVSADENSGVQNGFVIQTWSGDTYNFYCDTEEEKIKFMKALSWACISWDTFIDFGEESKLNSIV